jgi:opacity protein-like surface antigen
VNNRTRTLTIILLIFLVLPLSKAFSQEDDSILKDFGISGRIGYMDITQASDSFKAVFGRSAGLSLGAGMKIDFAYGIFFEASVDYLKRNGKRVFVSGSEVFKTDLDTNVIIIPVSFSGGYYFIKNKKISPYIGGGYSLYYFKEEELIPWENGSSLWHGGYHVLGGVNFLNREALNLSVEAKWSHVPDVIGNHGVSAYYKEDNIGGLSIIFKINFHIK